MEYTLETMQNRVLEELDQSLAGNQRLTNTILKDNLNLGYARFAEETLAIMRRTVTAELQTAALVGAAAPLTGRLYTLPDDMFRVMEVKISGASAPLDRRTLNYYRQTNSNWFDQAAVAPTAITHFYPAGNRKIGLYPPPNAAGTDILVLGFVTPVASPTASQFGILVNTTDEPLIEGPFQDALVFYATWRLAAFKLADVGGMDKRAANAWEMYQYYVARGLAQHAEQISMDPGPMEGSVAQTMMRKPSK